MMRAFRILIAVLVLVLAGGWAFAWFQREPGESWPDSFARLVARQQGLARPMVASPNAVTLPSGARIGGDFALTDQTGRPVTEASYRGKAMLIFFGFTHCPDVCPTELSTLATAMDQLGPDAARVQPLFITVDPERDTPEKLADYVGLFHPALAGLTGTPAQIAQVAKAYRVYYAKVTPPGASDYLMDHSAFVYLLGPDGALRGMFRPGATPEELAAAARQVLG